MDKVCKKIIEVYGTTNYSLESVLKSLNVSVSKFADLKSNHQDFVDELNKIEATKVELIRSKVISQCLRGDKDAIRILQKEIQKESNTVDNDIIRIEFPRQLNIDENGII